MSHHLLARLLLCPICQSATHDCPLHPHKSDNMQAILARERLRGSELTQHLKQAKQALVKRGQLVEELRARVCLTG